MLFPHTRISLSFLDFLKVPYFQKARVLLLKPFNILRGRGSKVAEPLLFVVFSIHWYHTHKNVSIIWSIRRLCDEVILDNILSAPDFSLFCRGGNGALDPLEIQLMLLETVGARAWDSLEDARGILECIQIAIGFAPDHSSLCEQLFLIWFGVLCVLGL